MFAASLEQMDVSSASSRFPLWVLEASWGIFLYMTSWHNLFEIVSPWGKLTPISQKMKNPSRPVRYQPGVALQYVYLKNYALNLRHVLPTIVEFMEEDGAAFGEAITRVRNLPKGEIWGGRRIDTIEIAFCGETWCGSRCRPSLLDISNEPKHLCISRLYLL